MSIRDSSASFPQEPLYDITKREFSKQKESVLIQITIKGDDGHDVVIERTVSLNPSKRITFQADKAAYDLYKEHCANLSSKKITLIQSSDLKEPISQKTVNKMIAALKDDISALLWFTMKSDKKAEIPENYKTFLKKHVNEFTQQLDTLGAKAASASNADELKAIQKAVKDIEDKFDQLHYPSRSGQPLKSQSTLSLMHKEEEYFRTGLTQDEKRDKKMIEKELEKRWDIPEQLWNSWHK